MAKHRTHSIEFKRQVALDFIAGETLHGLARCSMASPTTARREGQIAEFVEDDEVETREIIGARQRRSIPNLQTATAGAFQIFTQKGPPCYGWQER